MKKLVLILGAVVMVASGVAAVSAYEAYMINVTAHIENAMTVDTTPIDFGTVFPEEWALDEFYIRVSSSFCDEFQERVTKIDYAVWVEWKPIPGEPSGEVFPEIAGAGGLYYAWLGDAMYIGINAAIKSPSTAVPPGDLTYVGALPPPGAPGTAAIHVLDGQLSKVDPTHLGDMITIGIDTPVFEGYWNAQTDVPLKQSGLDHPTLVIREGDERYFPDGVDLGADIKIQITNIFKP